MRQHWRYRGLALSHPDVLHKRHRSSRMLITHGYASTKWAVQINDKMLSPVIINLIGHMIQIQPLISHKQPRSPAPSKVGNKGIGEHRMTYVPLVVITELLYRCPPILCKTVLLSWRSSVDNYLRQSSNESQCLEQHDGGTWRIVPIIVTRRYIPFSNKLLNLPKIVRCSMFINDMTFE